VTVTLRKFTKIPRKPRARNEPRPPRKPLQRVKTEGKDPAQILRRDNDDTSAEKLYPRSHSPCQKELPKVFPSSNKRKRSPEEGDNLKSDSAQLPAASQLPAGRAIVVRDHDRTATSQPRTDHNQSPALTDYSTPLESCITSHLNPASVDPCIEPKEIECENPKPPPLVTPHGTHHSASQARPVWDSQHHGVALGEHPERFTSNPTSHGETLDDVHS
jgi:hypothetical protein